MLKSTPYLLRNVLNESLKSSQIHNHSLRPPAFLLSRISVYGHLFSLCALSPQCPTFWDTFYPLTSWTLFLKAQFLSPEELVHFCREADWPGGRQMLN